MGCLDRNPSGHYEDNGWHCRLWRYVHGYFQLPIIVELYLRRFLELLQDLRQSFIGWLKGKIEGASLAAGAR